MPRLILMLISCACDGRKSGTVKADVPNTDPSECHRYGTIEGGVLAEGALGMVCLPPGDLEDECPRFGAGRQCQTFEEIVESSGWLQGVPPYTWEWWFELCGDADGNRYHVAHHCEIPCEVTSSYVFDANGALVEVWVRSFVRCCENEVVDTLVYGEYTGVDCNENYVHEYTPGEFTSSTGASTGETGVP